MRLDWDPMPALRAEADARVTTYFSQLSHGNIHLEMAYRRKKDVAKLVLAGEAAPPFFAEEAVIRGMTPTELASVVAAKPDVFDERELARQKIKERIRNAATPGEVELIFKDSGVPIPQIL